MALGAAGAFAVDGPVPWPRGEPPAPAELDRLVDDAVERADRERAEELLDAFEPGEDREHMTVYQEDVDAGEHDLAELFRFGDALFEHEFRRAEGLGDALGASIRRVHDRRGGLDGFSCAGCHSVGGPDGAGADTQSAHVRGDGERMSSANARNPPALLGLGFVQALAFEMTRDLQAQRAQALATAAARGAPVGVALSSKGVLFGTLVARADGTVDTGGVQGVSADLVVRPFGWKGEVARLRRFVEEAARIHFGIQSHVLALEHQGEPDPDLGPGPWFDPDDDGVAHELQEGSLTAAAVYLAMLETPVIIPPADPGLLDRWSRGAALFESSGCADCHRLEMNLTSTFWQELPDTTGGPPVVVNLLRDGDAPRGTTRVALFSDLKRHDMGRALAEPDDAPSIGGEWFLTRPLWGLADTAPYLHDGRAATIAEAILAHDGEAATSRNTYAALDEGSQVDLHLFLVSLTREPKPRIAR